MAGLMLKLRPYEAVMVNGAVIENGRRESRLRIATSNVNVLRLREALSPDEVDCPLAEAYYAAQLAVVGVSTPEAARENVGAAIERARRDARADGPEAVETVERLEAQLRQDMANGAFYRIMRTISPFLHRETEIAGPP